MTTMKDEAKTAPWSDVQTAALKMRESADELLDAVDRAMASNANLISDELEAIKARVLQEYAPVVAKNGRHVQQPRPAVVVQQRKPSAPRGRAKFACDICKQSGKRFSAKNSTGLAIHMGRVHKAERAEREATKADTVSAPDFSGDTGTGSAESQ